MKQSERRIFLIKELEREMPQYEEYGIPAGEENQWLLLRSLMNVRDPMPVSRAFLDVQDAFLQQMVQEKGIVDGNALEPCRTDLRLVLWQGDITTLQCDAIVNAANSQMLGCFRPCHNCIDNIEHTMAGVQMRLACQEQMQKQGYEEPEGRAKITSGYNLPAKYVLHTVGPMVTGPLTNRHKELLASCYRSCLKLAAENGCTSVAFCCISTGVFMFPQKEAAKIAVQTVKEYLEQDERITRVIFNVFKDSDREIYENLLNRRITSGRRIV